ncbi:MAG: rod shape-determining protein MreC [Candidatus Limiplasma sp.]|nr:rod shape-determining protein MreC [Candidatus Limiplasma sp.]
MRLKVPKTERRKSTDSTGRRVLRRVLLIGAAIVLLGLAGSHLLSIIMGNAALNAPSDAVAGVLTPIQSGFSSLVDGVVNYLYRLKLRSTIELAYNNLKQENEQLVYQAMWASALQEKLSVYENLYGEISINESMSPLVCTVIGRDPGNYFSSFIINKGGNDGIENFMAVTMGGALVGYTYDVSPTKSAVRTIIDSEASIAALISGSRRDQGTVRGTLGIDGQAMCRMYYLPEDHLPRPGDMVVTSGIEMSFPKGIPIGTVRESTRGMESNKQYIVVEPQADFQHIEYVIVLRYKPDAEAIQNQAGGGQQDLTFTPLDTAMPIPTIQIGNNFYQLAPTPTPSPEPSPTVTDSGGPPASPGPTVPPEDGSSLEYQVPAGLQTDQSYGYTLAPTATPTPTPEPLDFSVEED